MLAEILQSQFDLYYQNLLRTMTVVKYNTFAGTASDTNVYYKYIYQQNNLVLNTLPFSNSSLTITIQPLTKLADTYTPLFTQQFIINSNTLTIQNLYYNESASLLVSSLSITNFTYSNTQIILPVLTQYINVYNVDADIYKQVLLLKKYYNNRLLYYDILTNSFVLPNILDCKYFDVILVPPITQNAINLIYLTTYDLLYATNLVSYNFINDIAVEPTYNYQLIRKFYSITQLNESRIQIGNNIYVKITNTINLENTVENNLLLKFVFQSYYPITYANNYNFFMIGYQKKDTTYVYLNNQYALIEPDLTKVQINGATLNPQSSIFIYKQSIVSANPQ